MSEPQRTVEVERKYDADAETGLPVWDAVPGVVEVTAGEARALDARYFDSADLALSRAGVALRRRTGGPDEGWHIKGPREGDGRTEWGWPLGDDEGIPEEVHSAIARWTTAPLQPLARIENARTAYELRGEGGVIAEFVDDRVRTTDLRPAEQGGGAERAWREWEMELGPAGPSDPESRAAFFTAVETAVVAAGGRVSASSSKLGRALTGR